MLLKSTANVTFSTADVIFFCLFNYFLVPLHKILEQLLLRKVRTYLQSPSSTVAFYRGGEQVVEEIIFQTPKL